MLTTDRSTQKVVPGRWRGEDECRDLRALGQDWIPSWVMGEGRTVLRLLAE